MSWWNFFRNRAFVDTTEASVDRANVRFLMPSDSRLYLDGWSRRQVREKVEWLWQNFGIVKEMVSGIARHTVGQGISLQIDSEDTEFNQAAEAQFEEWALTPSRCDATGRRNLYEAQLTAVEQRLLAGEFVAMDVENPAWDNEPAFLLIEPNDIRDPSPHPERCHDGVEVDAVGRPVRYHLRTEDCKTRGVDPALITHWYRPHTVNAPRGVSEFAQAVNGLVDIHELKRLTTRTAKAHQLVALVMKGIGKKKTRGAFGKIDQMRAEATGDNQNGDVSNLEALGQAAGAGIAYTDENGDVKLVTSNSPSPLVEGFITDLLMRDVSLAPGVPMEFFWNPAKLGGANTRFILSRADLLFQSLSDALIHRWLRRLAFRFIEARIRSGKLKTPTDPNWQMSWQTPARITVDNGRDGALDIAKLSNGLLTLRSYYNQRGQSYRRELQQWFREWKEAKQIATDEGVPEALSVFRASMPGAQGATSSQQEEEEDSAEDEVEDAAEEDTATEE